MTDNQIKDNLTIKDIITICSQIELQEIVSSNV